MSKTAQKTRISALLPMTLVLEVRRESERRKTTQSDVLANALEYWLSRKLSKDAKTLSVMHFDDLPCEDDWLKIQAK